MEKTLSIFIRCKTPSEDGLMFECCVFRYSQYVVKRDRDLFLTGKRYVNSPSVEHNRSKTFSQSRSPNEQTSNWLGKMRYVGILMTILTGINLCGTR